MSLRRMCVVSLNDRKCSDELLNHGMGTLENKIQRRRLRWFGHVARMPEIVLWSRTLSE
jgi:hypothetical protein